MNRFVDIFKVFSSSKFELFLGQQREKLLSINYNVNIELKVKKCDIFQPTLCCGLSFALSLDAEALKCRKISLNFKRGLDKSPSHNIVKHKIGGDFFPIHFENTLDRLSKCRST